MPGFERTINGGPPRIIACVAGMKADTEAEFLTSMAALAPAIQSGLRVLAIYPTRAVTYRRSSVTVPDEGDPEGPLYGSPIEIVSPTNGRWFNSTVRVGTLLGAHDPLICWERRVGIAAIDGSGYTFGLVQPDTIQGGTITSIDFTRMPDGPIVPSGTNGIGVLDPIPGVEFPATEFPAMMDRTFGGLGVDAQEAQVVNKAMVCRGEDWVDDNTGRLAGVVLVPGVPLARTRLTVRSAGLRGTGTFAEGYQNTEFHVEWSRNDGASLALMVEHYNDADPYTKVKAYYNVDDSTRCEVDLPGDQTRGEFSIENNGDDRYMMKRNGVLLDWFTFDDVDPADWFSVICAVSCPWFGTAALTPALESFSIENI